MILYPAIDILGGNAVRLTKGAFDERKVYEQDPFKAASEWVEAGAHALHVVDLDGAKGGAPVNLDQLSRIAGETGVPVQFGGGLRSLSAIEGAIDAGADRVILGTAAFTDQQLLSQALERWPEKVLVSVDVRGGHVTTAGWTKTTEITTASVITSLATRGAKSLVFTNVDRDGMLEGPDLQEVRTVGETVTGTFQYSGGIGSLADLEALVELDLQTMTGVIVGKALYERRFTVAQAMRVLDS